MKTMPLPPGTLLESTHGDASFLIVRHVSRGLEADVYEARRHDAAHADDLAGASPLATAAAGRVAVKVAQDADIDIEAEARRQQDAWVRTGGACVAPIIATGMVEGHSFLVTPWYETLLTDWLKRTPDVRRRLGLLSELATKVLVLHRAGDGQRTIVHADLKPSNVAVIDPPGHVILIDFGSSRAHGPGDRTAPAPVTAAYVPPGAFSAERRRPYLDGFALAAIVHAAIVGAPPSCCSSSVALDSEDSSRDFDVFRGRLRNDLAELQAAARRHLGEIVPNRDALVEDLVALVREGLEPNPDLREVPDPLQQGASQCRMLDRWLLTAPTRLLGLAHGQRGTSDASGSLADDMSRIIARVRTLKAVQRLALLPWATSALIAACVALTLGTAFIGGAADATRDPAIIAWANDLAAGLTYRRTNPSLSGLFTSLFLHGSLSHLFGNGLMLLLFGWIAELRHGRLYYLLRFLLYGAAANVIWSHLSSSEGATLGASGAIAGLMGYQLMESRRGGFWRVLLAVGTAWVAKDWLLALMGFVDAPGINNLVHVVGASIGVGDAWRSRPSPRPFVSQTNAARDRGKSQVVAGWRARVAAAIAGVPWFVVLPIGTLVFAAATLSMPPDPHRATSARITAVCATTTALLVSTRYWNAWRLQPRGALLGEWHGPPGTLPRLAGHLLPSMAWMATGGLAWWLNGLTNARPQQETDLLFACNMSCATFLLVARGVNEIVEESSRTQSSGPKPLPGDWFGNLFLSLIGTGIASLPIGAGLAAGALATSAVLGWRSGIDESVGLMAFYGTWCGLFFPTVWGMLLGDSEYVGRHLSRFLHLASISVIAALLLTTVDVQAGNLAGYLGQAWDHYGNPAYGRLVSVQRLGGRSTVMSYEGGLPLEMSLIGVGLYITFFVAAWGSDATRLADVFSPGPWAPRRNTTPPLDPGGGRP